MSSRLIIKNLPPYATPERLRQHFQQKGAPAATLTDAKVSMKQDGSSRRFGFVGFKTPEEAARAQAWFDRTFIDSVRIDVKVVEEKGHEPSPRPNKRARTGPSPSEASTSRLKTSSAPTEGEGKSNSNSKQLQEFMEVMQTKKGPSWANETSVGAQPVVPPASSSSAAQGQGQGQIEDVAMEDATEAPAEGLSDMEWLRQRTSANVDNVVVEKLFEQSDDEDETMASKPAVVPMEVVEETRAVEEQAKDPVKETILQTSRLFVRNLTFSCTEEELAEHFRPFGRISQIHIPLDPSTKQSKGLAYITYATPSEAVDAYVSLDRRPFQGRLLHILGAVDRRGRDPGEGGGGGGRGDGEGEREGKGGKGTVKGEVQARRKALAGKEFNWSMLYMNSDAVASSIADRMGIPKSAILNPDDAGLGAGASVKLALAETHIITETKAYLESHGINLSSFSSSPSTKVRRSDTVILVKNIPYGTTEEQIREMFGEYGELGRVLVPPSGTIAVVEYVRGEEAGRGFRGVAYRRVGSSVVYLERAPVGVFSGGVAEERRESEKGVALEEGPVGGGGTESGAAGAGAGVGAGAVEGGGDGEADVDVGSGTTLYIKNLSFATTQEKLTQLFKHLPGFAFARIQTKPDPKRPGARLSMGYGFVGFRDVEGARGALEGMRGVVVDGHALGVKMAGRGKEEVDKELGATGVGGKTTTTKMIVKNVPFESTKKDIRDLFSAHGKLKSVRMPKKFDARTRGFAFLEFVSRLEAENAFNALKHTHLLGRHLVLQWAEEEGAEGGEGAKGLEALRRKTGVGYGDGKGVPGRKRKLDMGREGVDPEGLEDE